MIFSFQNKQYDMCKGYDLSIPVRRDERSVEAFYIPHASMEPYCAGSFVGSVPQGGACNCENILFNAHGNGTHTECVGHVSLSPHYMTEALSEYFWEAALITIQPKQLPNGDFLIMPEQVESQYPSALIIRTLPNLATKLYQKYSGNNPVYLHPDTALKLREAGVIHLLVDLPSVDREEDGGALAAHKNFWNYPENTRFNSTITELIFVPDEVKDGRYLLNLMCSGMESDAVPSKPVIYSPLPY